MNLVAVFLAAHIGAISGRSRAAAGKWAALGFWGAVWGEGGWENAAPHTEFGAPPPPNSLKMLASVAVWGGGGEWRCFSWHTKKSLTWQSKSW
jgi:hypothetical protein